MPTAQGKNVLFDAASLDTGQVGKVQVAVDFCLVNDGASHHGVDFLSEADSLFDNSRVVVIIDHDTPSGSEAASVIQRKLIDFAKKHNTAYHHGEGAGYQLMIDKYVKEGQVVVGCGEHAAIFGAVGAIGIKVSPEELAEVLKTGLLTIEAPQIVNIRLSGRLPAGAYAKDAVLAVIRKVGTTKLAGKLIEFSGDAFQALTLNDRLTICNLAGKTGAVSAVVNLGETASAQGRAEVYSFDLAGVKPLAAGPDDFAIIDEVSGLGNMRVNEVFIGGCSGGRIEDLRVAASIVRGQKLARGLRMVVAPISSDVYLQALREGLIDDFIDAGAVVMNQGCSTCWGKSQGILDADEVLVSAGSYNCKGCAGAESAKIYVTSAATAAKSAIAGVIAGPRGI